MSKSTTLAEGQITTSPHNTIAVELVEPEGMQLLAEAATGSGLTLDRRNCLMGGADVMSASLAVSELSWSSVCV